MVLFALPLVGLTACGDDEPEDNIDDEPGVEEPGEVETYEFTDFSVLMGKTRQETIDFIGSQPAVAEMDYLGFDVMENVKFENVSSVFAWFSYFDENVLDNVVIVQSFLDLDADQKEIVNSLNRLYTFEGIDEDGWYEFHHKKLIIYFIPVDEEGAIENQVQYINTDVKEMKTRSAEDWKAVAKASRKYGRNK